MPGSHRERQTERRRRKTEDAHPRGKARVAAARAEAPRAHRGRLGRAQGGRPLGARGRPVRRRRGARWPREAWLPTSRLSGTRDLLASQ